MYEAIISCVLTYAHSISSGKCSQIEHLGTVKDRRCWVRRISRVAFIYNLSAASVMASESQRSSFQRLRTYNSQVIRVRIFLTLLHPL
jgi:hypothetical protein